MRTKSLDSLIILVSSLIFFMVGLSGQEIVGFDSRFYLFAQEMWQHGVSWFPTTYQQPYPDYPATSTIIIYWLAKGMGGLSKPVAVFPSAFMAAITLVFTYWIGALQSRRYGWYAVFMLLLTFAFVHNARAIALDMYSAAIVTACFYLVYAADVKKREVSFFLLYSLFVCGFLFRGPIGLVMPTGVVCVYYLLDNQFKKCLRVGVTAVVLLMLCLLCLFAIAYYSGGTAFMKSVLNMEVSGRMDAPTVPRFYYFTTALLDCALSYPLALIVLLTGIFYALRRGSASTYTHLMLKLAGWMIVILIGMSIPGDKKIRYILAMLPAAALLSGYLFVAPAHQRIFNCLRWLLLRTFFILPAAFFIAILSLFYKHPALLLTAQVPVYEIVGALCFIQIINVMIVIRKPPRRGLYVTALAVVSFMMMQWFVMEPIELHVERTRDFVMSLETNRSQHGALLIFYREPADGLPIKYVINMPTASTPLFVNDVNELSKMKGPAFIVTRESYFKELPTDVADKMIVITCDHVGHVPVVVFKPKE